MAAEVLREHLRRQAAARLRAVDRGLVKDAAGSYI